MSLLKRITISPEVMHGRPTVRGTRVRVADALGLLAAGSSESEILADYPYLELGDIKASLEYAAAQAGHAVLSSRQRVRFLINPQLPPALARVLVERGHIAEHVADIGLLAASGAEVWRQAIEHTAALITKDEDFADQVLLGTPAPAIVWVRLGNTTRRALLDWFVPLLEQVTTMIDSGERLIEPRQTNLITSALPISQGEPDDWIDDDAIMRVGDRS